MTVGLSIDTACMLCDEPFANGRVATISASGVGRSVRCCPECYAMFCDLRTELRLMPSASCNLESCKDHSDSAANRRSGVNLSCVCSLEIAPAPQL